MRSRLRTGTPGTADAVTRRAPARSRSGGAPSGPTLARRRARGGTSGSRARARPRPRHTRPAGRFGREPAEGDVREEAFRVRPEGDAPTPSDHTGTSGSRHAQGRAGALSPACERAPHAETTHRHAQSAVGSGIPCTSTASGPAAGPCSCEGSCVRAIRIDGPRPGPGRHRGRRRRHRAARRGTRHRHIAPTSRAHPRGPYAGRLKRVRVSEYAYSGTRSARNGTVAVRTSTRTRQAEPCCRRSSPA